MEAFFSLGRTMKLSALPYHKDVAGHLRTGEAALWSWFESDQFSRSHADRVKLELLKSADRLTRADRRTSTPLPTKPRKSSASICRLQSIGARAAMGRPMPRLFFFKARRR